VQARTTVVVIPFFLIHSIVYIFIGTCSPVGAHYIFIHSFVLVFICGTYPPVGAHSISALHFCLPYFGLQWTEQLA